MTRSANRSGAETVRLIETFLEMLAAERGRGGGDLARDLQRHRAIYRRCMHIAGVDPADHRQVAAEDRVQRPLRARRGAGGASSSRCRTC